MKYEWRKVRLGDVCEKIGSGATPKGGKDAYFSSGISLIRSQNVLDFVFSDNGLAYINHSQADKLKNVCVKEGDVLLNITGDSVARSCMVDASALPARVNQHVAIIRGKRGIISNSFILYYLQMKKPNLLMLSAGGATRKALTKQMIEDLSVNLPEISEQNKIVKLLDDIQAKIYGNIAINKNLDEQVQAIFKAWFEDFSHFDGEKPAEWKYTPLDKIANISSGKRPSKKSTLQTALYNIPVVGASNIMGYTNKANNLEKILVIGRVGTHGIVQRFNSPCWASDNTLVITSKYYEYVYQILQKIDYTALNRGSTQPLITQSDMKKVLVLLPDENTMEGFEQLAGTLMLQYEHNIIENTHLSTLRDTLLPRLMSGEIDVSNIEI